MQAQHRLVSLLRGNPQRGRNLVRQRSRQRCRREENYTWKKRLLTPVNTIHLFILQVLNQNTPINDLPHRSGESFTGSAYCKGASGSRWESFCAWSTAWPRRSCLAPAVRRLTTRAAGTAIGSSSWTGRVAPCPTRPSCRKSSVSRATSVPVAASRNPSDAPGSRRHGAAPGDVGRPAAHP